MPILFDSVVAPDDLTLFTREVPVPAENVLSNEFPMETSDDNTIDFGEIVQTNRTAKYRAFDGRVSVSARDAGSTSRVRLAPLSTSLEMGEFERLQLEFARNAGTNTGRLVTAAYNDAQQLTREVQNRLELAWGDTLTDGKLTINENGLSSEADYGVPGGHIVAPGTLWSDTTNATVLTNIQSWADVWRATNGSGPGRMKTSQAVLRLVQRNKEVIDALYGATQGRTRASLTDINDLLAAEGLPTFDPAYDMSFSVDGVTTRTISDDRVAMLPTDLSTLGKTVMGVSATALELVDSADSDMSFEEAPGIVGVVFKGDGVPFRQYVYVDAVGMPVLTNAKRLLVADVK